MNNVEPINVVLLDDSKMKEMDNIKVVWSEGKDDSGL
jgi:hypothetical protein